MLHINDKVIAADSNRKPGKFDYNIEYMPEAGMLGTEYVGSDRYAVVCISVDSPKRVSLLRLGFDDEDEMMRILDIDTDSDGVQRVSDETLEEIKKSLSYGDIEKWSMRRGHNGKNYWKEMNKAYSTTVHWGIAKPYRDPDF